MLDSAPGLLEHNVTQDAAVVGRGFMLLAVGNSEVLSCVVAVQKDVDAVDLGGVVLWVGWQREPAIG